MINSFHGVGNLTREPEAIETKTGTSLTKFGIAVDSGFGDHKRTDFLNCICFGKLAEIVASYGEKGKRVYIQGSIQIDKFDNDKGTQYFTNIKVDDFKMLSPKSEGGGRNSGGGWGGDSAFPPESTGDDTPF